MELKQDTLYYSGMYRGEVVDNIDPDQAGRVRVRVFGIFKDEILDADLPWAVPAMPIFTGSGSGYGNFAVPEIGTHVFVFFESGDVYQPTYFAEAPNKVHGLPSERTTNYPNRRIQKTKSGIVIMIDDKDNVVKIIHPTGKYFEINENGNVFVSAEKLEVDGQVQTNTVFNVNGVNGWSGSFKDGDDKTVTVSGGIIINVV